MLGQRADGVSPAELGPAAELRAVHQHDGLAFTRLQVMRAQTTDLNVAALDARRQGHCPSPRREAVAATARL